ncbi:hypothetical protein BB559_000354 [Furculomyces boomerangus]|uniref:Uncharacterized protein n=2 Tax=Harpellales TaxID=61421 RepID=A0A2T9Z5H2_9FUNG|nr:hypothetical protein BB559_000354 [Furculomyces boomerangus]PWA01649.1 hypothetical protein BB558_002229 [Smittium angustum]
MRFIFTCFIAIVAGWPNLAPITQTSGIPQNYNDVKNGGQGGVLSSFNAMTVSGNNKENGVNFSILPSEQSKYANVSVVAYDVVSGNFISPVGQTTLDQYNDLGINRGGILTAIISAAKIEELNKKTNNTAARLAIIGTPNTDSGVTKWISDSVVLAFSN